MTTTAAATPSLNARRPRFLAEVPGAPAATPARFASATTSRPPPPPGRRAPADDPACGVPAAPQPTPEDLLAARREALERVGAAVSTLRAQAERLAEGARADAIEIGFLVARRILEAELRTGPDALFALVRTAVRRAGESRRITVRLAPDDVGLLETEAGQAAIDGLTAARIELQPDPALSRGDCLVDTDFGQVDGRLATRLGELRRAVDAATEEM